MWQLVLRLGGQLRTDWGRVTGWDMTAALTMGQAMGLPGWFLADVLPEIEHEMLKQLKEMAGK